MYKPVLIYYQPVFDIIARHFPVKDLFFMVKRQTFIDKLEDNNFKTQIIRLYNALCDYEACLPEDTDMERLFCLDYQHRAQALSPEILAPLHGVITMLPKYQDKLFMMSPYYYLLEFAYFFFAAAYFGRQDIKTEECEILYDFLRKMKKENILLF